MERNTISVFSDFLIKKYSAVSCPAFLMFINSNNEKFRLFEAELSSKKNHNTPDIPL